MQLLQVIYSKTKPAPTLKGVSLLVNPKTDF